MQENRNVVLKCGCEEERFVRSGLCREGGGRSRRVCLWGSAMAPAREAECVVMSFIGLVFFFPNLLCWDKLRDGREKPPEAM